ncbi:GumC family protein [Methylobacterium sp. Leaf118]|uniref:GumC family protein n=1 Tax=Methylobacterium sp. Leaf118 TaxID=2876562 RepID=UPI001E3C4D6C|nr:GumC family protein [Methylobacterium sp. Leaf118]
MLDGPLNLLSKRPPAAAERLAGYAEVASWLLQRWSLIAVASCLCAFLTYGASLLVPPSFVATTTLFIDSRGIQPLAGAAGQPPSGDNNFEVSFIESQARIVTSRSVLSRVVAAQGLADDPASGAGTTLADRFKDFIGAAPAEPPSAESRRLKALQALADRVTVKRPERTFIMEVSVRASTPETAARLANAVAQAYLDEQTTAHASKARRANDALTSRLDELRNRLRQSQARAQAYREKHGLVGTRTQLSSEQQLTEANAQLAQARQQRVQSRAHLDGLSRAEGGQGSEGVSPEAVTSLTISQLRSKQADAKRQLDSALTQFGARHPAVRDARDQLASIDRSLQAELVRIRQAAQREYQRASAAERASQAIVDRLSNEATDTSSALSELAQLQQEVDVNKNLLNTFLSRSREMGEIEQLDTSTARIISTAEPPLQRAFPPRGIVFLVLGGALGFWLAVACIVLQRTRILSTWAGRIAPATGTALRRLEQRDLVS